MARRRQVVVRADAAADVDEAYRWYVARWTGYGEKLLVQIGALLEQISELPGAFPRLRIRPNAELGTLDHDFHAPDAIWTVPARVVPNGSGSEFMITFFQPPSFARQFFEEQLVLVDKELAQLKSLMESA